MDRDSLSRRNIHLALWDEYRESIKDIALDTREDLTGVISRAPAIEFKRRRWWEFWKKF